MRCPDWLEHLPSGDAETPPPRWEEVKLHLQSCGSCRDEALRRDPLLAFRLAVPAPADAADVRAMQSAVRTLRRAGPRQTRTRWSGRVAVAALFAIFALLLPTGLRLQNDRPELGTEVLDVPAMLPLIEEIESDGARVYELRGDGLSVVMIVDDSLDLDDLGTSRS